MRDVEERKKWGNGEMQGQHERPFRGFCKQIIGTVLTGGIVDRRLERLGGRKPQRLLHRGAGASKRWYMCSGQYWYRLGGTAKWRR